MRYYKPIVWGAFLLAAAVVLLMRTQPSFENRPASAKVTPIDLSRYANAQLTDSLNDPKGSVENTLDEFPTGRQVMANVPFEISGVVQISGKKLREWGRTEFPESIEGIPVNKVCRRVSLLHGGGCVFDPDGTTVARLVFHYSDNVTPTFNIKVGEHVRDWWGWGNPYQSMAHKGTELAWAGHNPATKKDGAAYIRIYRSTFINRAPRWP